MKNYIFIMMLAFAATACSFSRISQSDDSGDTAPDKKLLYASAVVYPDGYDWRKDSLDGKVPIKLVLFMGRDSILALDVGELVRADADMHRIVDGKLYCDYSSDSSTVICCNGKEILSWSGRENIVGFCIRDGDVYTLGSSRSGSGWSFRKNGQVIMSRNGGFLSGPLYEDRDSLCFTFVESVNYGGKEAGRRYFYTCGNRATQLLPNADAGEVHAIRLFGGQLNYLASSTSLDGLIWQRGENADLLNLQYAEKTRDHSFIVSEGKLYAHAQRQVFWWIDTFWSGSNIVNTSGSAFQVYARQDESPFLCYVYSRDGGTSKLGIDIKGEKHLLPQSFRMPCSNAFCCDDRQCCLGLNDADNDYKPLIIKGVDTLRFDFNGYFTSLYLP